jgi:hypothetical protein
VTRPLLRLLAGAALLLSASACASAPAGPGGGSTSSPSPSASSSGAAPSALDQALPGLYGLAALGATLHGSTVRVAAPTTCAAVLDMLRAGQWQLDVYLQPRAGKSQIYAAVLRRGNRAAVLRLTETSTQCSGEITHDQPAALTVSGALSGSGTARVVPLACMVVADDLSDTSAKNQQVLFIGAYQTSSATFVVEAGGPAATGQHAVDLSADSGGMIVTELPAGRAGLLAAARAFAVLLDPTQANGASSDNPFPGVDVRHLYGVGGGAGGTLDVTSVHPLVATVSASKLVPAPGGHGQVAVRAELRCDP